jgi:hypothetical protein
MDEPTSGLDAATSFQLAKALRELADKRGKTIVCTVHQPSAAMLGLWTHLILVGFGGVVYEGDISAVAGYLSRIGHPVGEQHKYNPVEYFVELLSDVTVTSALKQRWMVEHKEVISSARADAKAARNSANHPAKDLAGGSEQASEPGSEPGCDVEAAAPAPVQCRAVLSVWRQTWVLTQRHALYTRLSLHGAKGMFARNILAGIFYGILYRNNGQRLWDLKFLVTPERGQGIILSPYLYNSVTFCFSVPLFIVFINMVPIPAMFAMKRYCDKEQANQLYCSFARWVSLIIVDIPVLTAGTCCFIAISLPMPGFRQSWYHYGLIVVYASVCGYAQVCLVC